MKFLLKLFFVLVIIFLCMAAVNCVKQQQHKTNMINLQKIQSIPQRDDERVFFTFPQSFDISDSGTIYITDQDAQSVYKFSPNGEFLRNIGTIGAGPGEFDMPNQVYCYGNTLSVWDFGNSRMEIFDTQDNYLNSIRITAEIQEFVRTENLIIAQQSKSWANNAASDEAPLIAMDSTGTIIKSFGQSVRAFVDIPQFNRFANAKVDDAFLKIYNNKIYLAHKYYGVVQVYSLDGEFEKAYSLLDDPYVDFAADNYNVSKVVIDANKIKLINLYKGFDVNEAGMFFCVNQYQDLNMDIHQFDFDGRRKNIYHYTLPQPEEGEGYWLFNFQCRILQSPQDMRFYVLMTLPYPELQVFQAE